ncbi:hypothetical protein [Isoptericola dokdonensis]|uniref:Minor tail protein n=1 Tax=Isoptericola dokdonensis DS-3 TaxID=1300344 RepID=A0A161II07_9MICO|nr:hypothetical protein [Isoptericola dokdonensis]ANC31424.1 hypothetical protein I598_1876 [Isoptericola dokdonensis DS-3]
MTQYGYPFEPQDTTESQYEALASEWQDTGVVASFGASDLKVSADSSGMQVTVQAGRAILKGFFFDSTAAETLAIEPADTSPRIDVVVVRVDQAADQITLAVVQGTPAANPSVPSLADEPGGVFELELARVAVGANVVTIAAANVTERRQFVGARTGSWSSATRPRTPRRRQLGFNETTGVWECWSGTEWVDLIPTTVPNARTVNGYDVVISTSTPSGTPTTNRIWIKPIN